MEEQIHYLCRTCSTSAKRDLLSYSSSAASAAGQEYYNTGVVMRILNYQDGERKMVKGSLCSGAGSWILGGAGQGICGGARSWILGRAGQGICGGAISWILGRAGPGICGGARPMILGRAGQGICGGARSWILGGAGQRICGGA